MIRTACLSLVLGAALSSFALELGAPFVDGAVLQRDKPVRVWGYAERGEAVKVSFAGQKRSAVADATGKWEAVLTPMQADATARELVVESRSGRIVVRDVVVGEVWLVAGTTDQGVGAGAQLAGRPLVRHLNGLRWERRGVSAISGCYALELHDALGVPVGIVSADRAGTDAASWKSLTPYAARGIVWHHGDDDLKMHESFDGLRRVMKDPTLKLYFCQVAPEGCGSAAAPEMLERQARFAMEEPNADMVVAADIGISGEAGLSGSETAAKRLAAYALHNDYGREDIKPWSPMPIGAVCETGNVVAVAFTHAEGLAVRRSGGGSELDFEIAGEDGAFVPAKLLTAADSATFQFKESTLRFVADGVREPKQIRHRRRSPRAGVLVNREGLPCGPFTMSVRPKEFDPVAWIQARLAAGASEVVLPTGRYRLDPKDGKFLELRGMTNATIDCSGSFFWGNVRKTLVSLVDCSNVTLKNLTLDYPFDMPFSQGVIEQVGTNGEWDVRVYEGYSDSIKWAWPVQAYDAKTRALVNPMRFVKGMTLTRLGPRRIRVAGGRNRKEKVGDVAVWSLAGAIGRAVHAVYIENCADCRLENVTVYSTPQSNGFRGFRGEGGTVYRRCRVVPCPPEDDPVPRALRRFRSGNHDAFNSRSLRRGGTYDFCEARNHCDDDVNINGGYWFISSVSGKVVRAMATDSYIDAFVCGPVQLMMPDGTVPVDTPEIVSFREVSGPTAAEREMLKERGLVFQLAHGINHAFEFTLAKPDERFRPGAVFVSQNAGGNDFRISNCLFGPNRARALILNASYGLVENCVFNRLESQAVRASSSYPWLEGGCSREVSVKGCVFYDTDCYFGANIGPGRMLPACSHRDIAICDNIFAGSSRLLVHGCTGLAISNNVFDCASTKAIELKNTEDVRLPEAAVGLSQAFEVRQVFREERFTRGNVNLRSIQAADAADWIWIADGGPAKGEMDAVRFIKDFVCGASGGRALPGGASGGRALPVGRSPRDRQLDEGQLEIDVSADERFVLFLDGREIARGPHKGLMNHWYYQSYKIDGLEPGPHRLEAVVYRMESVRPRGVLSAGKGGFLLKASGAYDALLTTGTAKWQAVRVRGTRMTGFGDSEGFGGSGQSVAEGTGFLDPAAASGAPCGVKVVRRRVVDSEYGVPRDGWALFPTERPDQMSARRQPGSFKAGQPLFRADTNIYYQASDAGFSLVAEMNALLREGKPVTIPAGTSARLVWDMDDYFCAYPILETSGGAGAEIRWGWAESLYDRAHARADRNAFDGKRCAHAMRDTFRPDGRARAAFTSPWWRCGRWCEFEVKTADAPLTLTKLAFDEVRYPLAAQASFDCDDASIADVWRLCLRGLENCMHETYMDCPYFEQQMYPGDTRVVMLIADALSGDARLTRFGIGHFDYARRDNGLVPMNSPCYLVQDSSTYSMCWVAMLGDYALWNGGKDFLKARLPGMRHTLHLLLNYTNEEGLLENLPGWSFQDWVEGWDFYGNAPDGRLGLSAVNNLLCVYALDSAVRVEELAGDKMMADYWRARKKALADAVLAKFWDDRRGMVADTAAHDRFSEHAQCLALLADILPPDRAARALDGLLTSPDLARTTVYFSHYLFDVYVKYGHTDRFLKRLDLWRDYVRTGLRTPLEAPGVRARSDCHAWGSHPIYHLLTGVAGIKPAADGFASVRIAPQPGGLKRISARMPTPKGMVSLSLRFEGDVPTGMVTLPEGLPGTFVWKGASRPLHAGENVIR